MPSARDIAFIACRLLALYVLYGAVQSLAFNAYFILNGLLFSKGLSLTANPGTAERLVEIGTNFVPLLTGLLMATVFWFSARRIARRIAPDSPAEGGWSPRGALQVGIVLLGLVLIVYAVPHIAGLARDVPPGSPSRTYDVVSIVLRCLAGAGLILGSGRIAEAVGRLRRW